MTAPHRLLRARRVVTTRAGGVSAPPYDSFNLADHVGDDPAAVAANRRRLASVLGLPPERFVWMEQIHSRNVTVVDGPVSEPVPATDALRYLSRHDIHAELKTVARDGDTVEERLEKEALALGAGLIVMGAFGRSRLRETIFGGVTRYLLTSGRVPLLLAH